MTLITIVIGCILGVLIGLASPTIPYTYTKYLAIAIVAAIDTVFGGIASSVNGKFDAKVFVSGFFVNAILAILLTVLGERLNIDIYLAAIIVFVGRMFNNLGIIRRFYLDKLTNRSVVAKASAVVGKKQEDTENKK